MSAAPGRFGDMTNPVIVVVGAGPGLGASVARRYGREGYDVALLSSTPASPSSSAPPCRPRA